MESTQSSPSELMDLRIKKILRTSREKEKVRNDFNYTFIQLGLNPADASELCEKLFDLLLSDRALEEIEANALGILEETKVGSDSLPSVLDEKLRARAELIFSQVEPHLKEVKGKVLDFGTGDGQVAQLLSDRLGLEMVGVDIRDYRKLNVSIPFELIRGGCVEVNSDTYSAVLLTNVLHHEQDNEGILSEVHRIVVPDGLVVILETVPDGVTEEEMESDKERTFMNDYLYNRLFHNADVPVPGTFETIGVWKERFAVHGMTLIQEADLGFDQTTIRDRHYLYVLRNEKN